jgi:hypothetical protein
MRAERNAPCLVLISAGAHTALALERGLGPLRRFRRAVEREGGPDAMLEAVDHLRESRIRSSESADRFSRSRGVAADGR